MTTVRIAVAQAAAVSGDVQANVRTAVDRIERAAAQGARILMMPELFLCGYDLDKLERDPAAAELRLDGPEVAALAGAAARTGTAVVIGAGVAADAPPGRTNSALVIDERGELVASYDKIHVWTTERTLFGQGAREVLVDLAGLRVGIGICYDAGFPEHARSLALQGAELLLYPSAFSRGGEEFRYDRYFAMRALENTVYLAVGNLVGTTAASDFFGRSTIFGPDGHTLAIAGAGDEIIHADVSRERIGEVRQELRYLEHRRTDVFGG